VYVEGCESVERHRKETAGAIDVSKYPRPAHRRRGQFQAAIGKCRRRERSPISPAMITRRVLPAGFIEPCIPVLAVKPPSGPQWVHEIKHDGYRLIVRRDGAMVRLWTRKATNYTGRLPAIAAAAASIKADSFTIDGEAVVAGPDGVAQFDELRRRQSAGAAFLYAFDLLEHDGEDLRNRPLLDRKAALARLLKRTKTGIVFNEHVAVEGAIVFDHACKLGAEGTVSKRITAPYRSGLYRLDQGQEPRGRRCSA
jgi:bifunctional non-homologous end joining protein LigD